MAVQAPSEKRPSEAAPTKNDERRLRFADPFDVFDDLQQEVARIWGQRPLLPRFLSRPMTALSEAAPWAPRVDVLAKDGELVIRAELPGVDKKDIKLSVVDGDLVIEGERKSEKEVREQDYYRMERMSGSFYRRLALPDGAKLEQIDANYRDGVLEISLPKAAPAVTARQIPVK